MGDDGGGQRKIERFNLGNQQETRVGRCSEVLANILTVDLELRSKT